MILPSVHHPIFPLSATNRNKCDNIIFAKVCINEASLPDSLIVISRNYFLSEKSKSSREKMRKLKKSKVEHKRDGEESVRKIAKSQRIRARWVRELYRRYVERREYPYLREGGRKKRRIEESEIKKVIEKFQTPPLEP